MNKDIGIDIDAWCLTMLFKFAMGTQVWYCDVSLSFAWRGVLLGSLYSVCIFPAFGFCISVT